MKFILMEKNKLVELVELVESVEPVESVESVESVCQFETRVCWRFALLEFLILNSCLETQKTFTMSFLELLNS